METQRIILLFRKLLLIGAVFSVLAATAATAQTPHGSLSPNLGPNGYPLYVEDVNGIRLDLPTPVPGDGGLTAPTLIFDPVLTGNPMSEAAGFGTEAFIFLATTTVDTATVGQALLTLGIEAAYGAGEPDPTAPPDQFLFARVRVRFTPTVAGTYTVTHPWGVETLEITEADLGGRFDSTKDWGGFAPIPNATIPVASSFERILYSPTQWRFLKATTLAPGVDPLAWIGDGVTSSTITGGLNNVNSFTITGPGGAIVAQTNLFTVSGHIVGGSVPPPPPAVTDAVTITRARLRGNTVEVRATSANGFAMVAELYNGTTSVGFSSLGTNGRANISFTGTPTTVRVRSLPTTGNIGGEAVAPVN